MTSEDQTNKRIRESRSQVATLIGLLRCENDPNTLSGEVISLPNVINRLWVTLDRLDRAIEGENYIEKRRRLSKEVEGYNFIGPPDSCLPPK